MFGKEPQSAVTRILIYHHALTKELGVRSHDSIPGSRKTVIIWSVNTQVPALAPAPSRPLWAEEWLASPRQVKAALGRGGAGRAPVPSWLNFPGNVGRPLGCWPYAPCLRGLGAGLVPLPSPKAGAEFCNSETQSSLRLTSSILGGSVGKQRLLKGVLCRSCSAGNKKICAQIGSGNPLSSYRVVPSWNLTVITTI